MEYFYNHDAKGSEQIQPLNQEVFRLVEERTSQRPDQYEQRVAWVLDRLRDHPKTLFAHPDAPYLKGNASSTTFTHRCGKELFDKELLELTSVKPGIYVMITTIKFFGLSVNVKMTWIPEPLINRLIRQHTIDLILEDLE